MLNNLFQKLTTVNHKPAETNNNYEATMNKRTLKKQLFAANNDTTDKKPYGLGVDSLLQTFDNMGTKKSGLNIEF